MLYRTKKPEPEPKPKEDSHLKVLERLEKTVASSLRRVQVETVNKEDPNYGKTVNDLSGLLLTSIKQNNEIVRVHGSQIDRAMSNMERVVSQKQPPVVHVSQQPVRSFHMDIKRGANGYIESVEGTIE